MWTVGGTIDIVYLGGRIGQILQLPFELNIPGQQQPTQAQVVQLATQEAESFLGQLGTSDPIRRGLFGAIGDVNVVFATFHF